MMSKLYREFINHCNEEMGIIFRCVARRLSAKDLIGYSGHSVVCLTHKDITFRGIAYKYSNSEDYYLSGVIVSSQYKYYRYACKFSTDLDALEWPEFFLSINPNEQVINSTDVFIGLGTHIQAERIILNNCPEIIDNQKIIDTDIDPMVHLDDDRTFITEGANAQGKVSVRVFDVRKWQLITMWTAIQLLFKK